MVEKLELLKRGLNQANNKGAFSMEEASALLTAYVSLKNDIEGLLKEKEEPVPLEEKKVKKINIEKVK